jgi:hypothetical protein
MIIVLRLLHVFVDLGVRQQFQELSDSCGGALVHGSPGLGQRTGYQWGHPCHLCQPQGTGSHAGSEYEALTGWDVLRSCLMRAHVLQP